MPRLFTRLSEFRREYGVTNVFADAWSAPAFMKTNDSQDNGGTRAYANYLTQYAKDFAQAGIPLSYIGPENEANIGPGYDSMILTPAQTANFMEFLGPTLARAGLRTPASFSLRATGAASPVAIPFLTDNTHHVAGQRPIRVTHGSFGATLPRTRW